MEMGQSFAFLGAFVASAVLSIVLAYIAKITGLRAALNLWSLGYALNAARLLVYAVAGVSPPDFTPFFLAEGFQVLQSLALLFGVLVFAGRPVSLARHGAPAVLVVFLLLALMAVAGGDGLLRVWPFYAVSAACLLLAGMEVARSGRRVNHTGSTFTAVVLILWGLHKLDFLLLPGGGVEIAQLRFMASAAFYTAAALGFAIMALTAFHRRLSRSQADNETHFRKMFEDAPVGYQSLDEEGRIVAVNRRWLDILGYAPDEVIGRSFADFLAPASRLKFPPRFASSRQPAWRRKWSSSCCARTGGKSSDRSRAGSIRAPSPAPFAPTACLPTSPRNGAKRRWSRVWARSSSSPSTRSSSSTPKL